MAELPNIEAQSYHLLRAADTARYMVSYYRDSSGRRGNNGVLPDRAEIERLTPELSRGENGAVFIAKIKKIEEGIHSQLGAMVRERNEFWHPADYSKSPRESQNQWRETANGISDERLTKLRGLVTESLDKIDNLKHGGKDLTMEQRSKLGLDKTATALKEMGKELDKVHAVRTNTMSPIDVESSRHNYQRCTELVGEAISQERYALAHPVLDNGKLNQDPSTFRKPAVNLPHTPRASGIAGVALAATAGVITWANGSSPAQAAMVTGEALASNVPGVSGRLADNPHEARVRDSVDAGTIPLAVVGAGAGAVFGGPVGAIIGAIAAPMLGEEGVRASERHVMGRTQTVAPSAGEQLIAAASQLSSSISNLDVSTTQSARANEKAIDRQLTANLPELNEKGWGKVLGDKDGKLTLNELKTTFPKGFDFKSIDKDGDNKFSGKEITDAITALKKAGVKADYAPAPQQFTPTQIVSANEANQQARR